MRKIYLITLVALMGNLGLLQASNPQNAKNNGSDSRLTTSASPNGGRNGSNIQFRHAPTNMTYSPMSTFIYSDNFDGVNDTASLVARGYLWYFRGTGGPGTSAPWFQGAPGTFPSLIGPPDGYLATNFNSVTLTNNIDNWLVLPAMALDSGDMFSFYSRSPLQVTPFVDSLHIYYSAAGDSIPEDTTWQLLGEFETNWATDSWEYKQFTIPSMSANGRLAIRYAVVNGGPDGANSNYVGIDQLNVFKPSSDDLSAVMITAPVSNCGLTASENVTIVVHNWGLTPAAGYMASFSVDGGTPVMETIPGPLAFGDEFTYTFTAVADLSAPGPHTILAGATNLGDTNHLNDTLSIVVNNIAAPNPASTVVTMGWEDTEDFSMWKVEDTNADGVSWAPINTFTHGGSSVTMRKAGSGATDDDWIFSSCLDLTGGTQYILEYWYKVFEVASACATESFLATAQSSASLTTTQISMDGTPLDTVYVLSSNQFTPATSGTYYVGFHATSPIATSAVRIDDIFISVGVGINSNSGKTEVSTYPNPSNGMFYLSSPIANDVLVEVFNITGQKVYTSRFDKLNHQFINMYNQPNGVYNVRITSDNYVQNHSVVFSK